MAGGIKAWEGLAASGPPDMGLYVLSGNESPERFSAVAYGMEEGLRSFYVILSEKTDDLETADLFTRLAGFEERHKDQVYDMYHEATETPLNREKFEAGIVSEVMEGGVSTQEFLEQISGSYHNPTEILELALSIEAQALDLYLRFADKADNKVTQRAAFKISNEEKMHLKELGILMGRKV